MSTSTLSNNNDNNDNDNDDNVNLTHAPGNQMQHQSWSKHLSQLHSVPSAGDDEKVMTSQTKNLSWDSQNLPSFLAVRSQLVHEIITSSKRNDVKLSGYVRSGSESVLDKKPPATGIVSPNKNYARAQSAVLPPLPPSSNQHPFPQHHGGSTHLFPDFDGDFFSESVRALFDIPLPLVGNPTAQNDPSIIHLRRPGQDEFAFLVPRLYLRSWFDWARNSIVNSSVQRWTNQFRGEERIVDSPSAPNSSGVFMLESHALRTLAALSIMADQYQLWEDEDVGEWTRWFKSMENRWASWIQELDHFRSKMNPSRGCEKVDSDSQRDEKKYDDDNNYVYHSDNLQFMSISPPGAFDCRILSSRGRPLQLRRNVALMMKGCSAEDTMNQRVLSVKEEIREEYLFDFLSIDESKLTDSTPCIAVCPVSASFYEINRGTLGVICEDGCSISFQPGSKRPDPTDMIGGDGRHPAALLYHYNPSHEKWSPLLTGAKSGKDIDIPHPSSTNSRSVEVASSSRHTKLPTPRPIEFHRRILTTCVINQEPDHATISSGPSSSQNKTVSSYSKLMKEAMANREDDVLSGAAPGLESNSCTVEVHPVEFRYVVVDPALLRTNPPTNKNESRPLQYSSSGKASVSRVTLLSDALTELKRAVEPNKSSACVRVWYKSHCAGNSTSRGATVKGDGYDLFDENDPPGESELTVEKWLRLDEKSRVANSEPAVADLLVEIRSSPTTRWARESLELDNRLQVGDFVDAQDTALKWYEAIVRELTPETVKVHYFGWCSRWDGVLPRRRGMGTKDISPPMPLWSKTTRWRDRIVVGSEIEVRQSASMAHRPKWYKAVVLAVGRESDSPRNLAGGAELEMNDKDETGKRGPLTLMRRKRQILIKVPQEKNNCPTPIPTQTPKQENGTPLVNPPFVRWVDLYGEEICEPNTHIDFLKKSNAPATVTYAMDSQRKKPVEVMKSFNNQHGAGFVRESLRGVPPAPGTVGLHNLGNSCYMNSILQCINHIQPITQYFLKGGYLKDVNKTNPLGSGGRVATAYASFLSEVWTGEYSILAPRLLKQTVGFFAPQFNNNYQHDSHEFCQYLMDGLHEDLNRVKEKPYVEHIEAYGMKDNEAALKSWKNHLLRHDSIFVDYTQGMHRSHLTCPSCGKESVKFDVYSSISLPLVPAKDRPSIPLVDCLDQFAAGEQLDEHNAWYCSTCKKHVCALKLITLWNTPDILILHLKRFTFEKCPTHDGRLLRSKIEDKVNFPIDRLDLSSYVLGPKFEDAPPVYKLFGVSEHSGATANSGHYTATIRNSKDGNWYRHNDSHVGSTSGDASVTGGAYLLFYQREKGSLRWAGMERQMKSGIQDEDGFIAVQGRKKKRNT